MSCPCDKPECQECCEHDWDMDKNMCLECGLLYDVGAAIDWQRTINER